MAVPFPSEHPYLSKGFEPIRFECEYADLIVEGEIPDDLNGCLYRIGPNPQFAPRAVYNPMLGDGMVHLFDIHRGRVSYRNRWVRTQQWQRERAAGRSLFGTSGNPLDADPEVVGVRTDGVANTNLSWHAGKLLALEEGHAPIELDPINLDTRGAWNFDGKLTANMTAYPRIDHTTGEMLFFANAPGGDFSGVLELYVADSGGNIRRRQRIEMPFPSLVHDFAITADFVLFFVSPVTISAMRARSGGPALAWEPEKRTWIGVVPRHSAEADVKWFSMPACMVWHAMNSFNEGDTIYLDVCQQSAAAFPLVTGALPRREQLQQFLTRWTLQRSSSADVAVERLSNVICEYPKIDDRSCGRNYRFGYVACDGGPGTNDLFHRAIARFDHHTRALEVYRASGALAVSEPIFVARHEDAEEGDGYLLTVIFDERRNASYLAILDARNIQSGPVARAHLDHRVPMGFHGVWRPRAGAS